MDLLRELFQALWLDYTRMTPQASRILRLLEDRGESVVNDHIALRTFSHPAVDIEVLDRAFVHAGYEPVESYDFPDKKLVASALLVEQCSPTLQRTVDELVAQVPTGATAQWRFAAMGRPWRLDAATYEALLAESQYAAWVAAFGFRANHFTVAAHELKTVASLRELDELLLDSGVRLNEEGGLIKGSREQGLEQSSTLADEIEVELSDGPRRIPSCYYEFAYRHPGPDGRLFQGFIAGSASHLFTSTDTDR
jgi:hypothetical protein